MHFLLPCSQFDSVTAYLYVALLIYDVRIIIHGNMYQSLLVNHHERLLRQIQELLFKSYISGIQILSTGLGTGLSLKKYQYILKVVMEYHSIFQMRKAQLFGSCPPAECHCYPNTMGSNSFNMKLNHNFHILCKFMNLLAI